MMSGESVRGTLAAAGRCGFRAGLQSSSSSVLKMTITSSNCGGAVFAFAGIFGALTGSAIGNAAGAEGIFRPKVG